MENKAKEIYKYDSAMTFKKETTALLCIDLQYHDASPGYGFFEDVSRDDPAYQYYFNRLEKKVFPTVKRLQTNFRDNQMEVIHVRIEALTKDGRDRSLGHKKIGCLVPKGSKAAEFIPQVAPEGDEIILSKTASGVFNSTNIHYILQNLGIETLVIVGVLTNECIDSAVRAACDLGYTNVLVEDGVAAFTEELHKHSLNILDGVYCDVVESQRVEKMI